MNVKAGDLALVAVPADWPRKTLDGKVVEVAHFVPPRGPGDNFDQRPTWWCIFQSAWFNDHGRMFTECPLLDSWLRPIAGLSSVDEIRDETPTAA